MPRPPELCGKTCYFIKLNFVCTRIAKANLYQPYLRMKVSENLNSPVYQKKQLDKLAPTIIYITILRAQNM